MKSQGSVPAGNERANQGHHKGEEWRSLLLCPPGRHVYQRDNYCSHRVKGRYYWYPYDLVVQSGWLDSIGEVEVLDGTGLELSAEEMLRRIAVGRYQAILVLIGGVCWEEDTAFLEKVARVTDAKLFVTGDVPRKQSSRTIEQLAFVDGVLTDYTSRGLCDHLSSGRMSSEGLVLRGDRQAEGPSVDGSFSIPVPRWDLFQPRYYSLPFLRRSPFASVATTFGCPHKCQFCTAASLPYRRRNLDNVLEELVFLKDAGYREIHFKDLSFGIDRVHYETLLNRMIEEGLGFSFNCLSRADCLSPESLQLMKRAGCHLVHIGVESAATETLDRVNKEIDHEQVRHAISNCRKAGIRVLASYVLGFPWERREDLLRTIDLAVEFDTDFASFNIFSERDTWPSSDGSQGPPSGRAACLQDIEHQAYRRFYFRPSYLVRRLSAIRSIDQLRLNLSNGARIFANHVVG